MPGVRLLSAFSQAPVEAFALVSDSAYIAQNAARIVRALFEVALKQGWSGLARRMSELARSLDRRMWAFQHPLRQYPGCSSEIIAKLEAKDATVDRLRDMGAAEVGALIGNSRLGGVVQNMVRELPQLRVEASLQPITRTILRLSLSLRAGFKWNDKLHGSAESFWIWVDDPDHAAIYHWCALPSPSPSS